MAELDMRVDPNILFMHAPEDMLLPIRDVTDVVDTCVFLGCIGSPFLHRRLIHDDQSTAV